MIIDKISFQIIYNIEMRPLFQQHLSRNPDLWASSSSTSSDDNEVTTTTATATAAITDNENGNNNNNNNQQQQHDAQSQSTRVSTTTTQPSRLQSPLLTNLTPNRRSLLPAYPSFERHNNRNQEEHLLRPHIPRHLLTHEQRQQRKHKAFHPPFVLVDQRRKYNNMIIPSFIANKYGEFFHDLARRLNVDVAILDYNYERLLKCLNIMRNERIQQRFQSQTIEEFQQLPIQEYSMALEFYLQIDVDLFYMKTCSFRGARCYLKNLFSKHEPDALYGLLRCKKSYCNFCFPTTTMKKRAQYYLQPVLEFSPDHRHQFINGYETILNCPVQCQTKNIIYALTCPCKQFDYIGYTSVSLGQRLVYHRAHGNRIIHEFLLGSENIRRVQTQPKSQETLVKDSMLLYKHSARCPYAMQIFLDCNPQYWPFIPMSMNEAQQENEIYHHDHIPNTIPHDPTSHIVTSSITRSDHDTGSCMVALPPFPSDQYTFSLHQSVEQFQFFKTKQDYRVPNLNLDLYDATIIAVLPDRCSNTLKHLIEALLITHAQTKLNKLGHLDGNSPLTTNNEIDRGNWCHNLIRRPTLLPP